MRRFMWSINKKIMITFLVTFRLLLILMIDLQKSGRWLIFAYRPEPLRFGVCLWVRGGESLEHVTWRTVFCRGPSQWLENSQEFSPAGRGQPRPIKGFHMNIYYLRGVLGYCLKALTMDASFLSLKSGSVTFSCKILGHLPLCDSVSLFILKGKGLQ